MTNAIGWFAGQSFTSADRTPASDDPQTCRMRGMALDNGDSGTLY